MMVKCRLTRECVSQSRAVLISLYRASESKSRVQHMVMIVPVDADVDEAENVAHEYRKEGCQRSDAVTMRNLHLQHHDRNDDRDDTVAEGLESVLAHSCALEAA
jgi:hypothetical protein